MNTENIELIKNIAGTNPEFFLKLLSKNHSFSVDMLQKFKDKLDWELLSSNPNLEWSDELIETFDYKWEWDILMKNKNAEMSIAIVQKYEVFKNLGYCIIKEDEYYSV